MTETITRTEQFWFLDTLVQVRIPFAAAPDGISILEHRAPAGDSPPLHIHTTEDEVFQILDGRIRVRIGNEESVFGPGAILIAPKGVAHTYRVESREGGHWLTVTVRGDFERFVRTMARPAERAALPPPGGPPTQEAVEAITATARRFGIEIVGPPLH